MKVNFETLYEHIGYLFYALASEFRKLSLDESRMWNELNKRVDQHWKVMHPQEAWLHLRLHEHIHLGIQNALSASLTPAQAFSIFEDFFAVHKVSFGVPLKEKIQKCSNEIAHDFGTLNHDSEMITEVKRLLETYHIDNSQPVSRLW